MKLNLIEANAGYDMMHGKPEMLEQDNDGSFLFRLNVQKDVRSEEGKEAKQVGWICFEIRTFEQPTKENLKRIIINKLYPNVTELMNNYNMFALGITTDKKALDDYKEFLMFSNELDVYLSKNLK